MPTRTLSATFIEPGPDDANRLRVEARTESGFDLRFDSRPAAAGGIGPGPTESILATLAACTAMDVASILRKKRQEVASYRIEVIAQKREAHPQVFTAITVEHQVTGAVTAEALRRSIELSATAYCPVSAMLSGSVPIDHRYRLQRDGADAEVGLAAHTGPPAG
ncbi:MAG TPA: OsmC family protein [Candidatus Limnocylindria bacterium]|nr:OsmC family protein [Candidatus Limnocylindria bacterium]